MKSFEKVSLGLFPTPITRLNNISRILGTNVWIKRDDLCGVALGGNKVRKLEYLLADAKKQGYDLVMTTGQAQSNHAMLTAACAKKMGMDCVLVLKKRGITTKTGNILLESLMGIDVRFVDSDSYDDIYREMDRIGEEMGRKVYKIPCGGSNALGSVGYVDCMREISETDIHFDHLYCACGSGGTAAGTLFGAKMFLPDTHVTIVSVDTDPFEKIVPDLARACAELSNESVEIETPDIVCMAGDGYSIPSPEGLEAMGMMLANEGIVLDPCYTGKAFAGLIKRAREGAFRTDENVLFIHTGGAGGVFAHR